MPFKGEKASGEALISLHQSKIFEEFEGKVREFEPESVDSLVPVNIADAHERQDKVTRIIAFDGSIVTQTVKNGFPGADASVVQIALVAIDLEKLLEAKDRDEIIRPKVFNEMDRAYTLQTVLPGRNVVEKDDESPKDFFRRVILESLKGKIVQSGHESLLDTFLHLMQGRQYEYRCPHFDECETRLGIMSVGEGVCACPRKRAIFATDRLRFHERFNDVGSNGEPHGEVMSFYEIVLLMNVLRYFVSTPKLIKILPTIAFVLDGPMAVFGQPAAITPWVKDELKEINNKCKQATGKDILVFSLVKSGPFAEHFEYLDFDQDKGSGKKIPESTLFLPDNEYIHKAIVQRSIDAKPWGKDTYFGRMVLYKTRSGQRMVLNTPILSDMADNRSNTNLDAYPRLIDVMEITDSLSTYLYEGGFIPIVRAHSHAAIPLKLGGQILEDLLRDA